MYHTAAISIDYLVALFEIQSQSPLQTNCQMDTEQTLPCPWTKSL